MPASSRGALKRSNSFGFLKGKRGREPAIRLTDLKSLAGHVTTVVAELVTEKKKDAPVAEKVLQQPIRRDREG